MGRGHADKTGHEVDAVPSQLPLRRLEERAVRYSLLAPAVSKDSAIRMPVTD